MTYIRKTRDIWEIQCNYGYGHGWECEVTEDNIKDARQRLKEYGENSMFPVRMVKKREPIN